MENRPENQENIFRRLFGVKKKESPSLPPEVVVIENILGVSTHEPIKARDPQLILKDCLEKASGWCLSSKRFEGIVFRGKTFDRDSDYGHEYNGDLTFEIIYGDHEYVVESAYNDVLDQRDDSGGIYPKSIAFFDALPDGSCLIGISAQLKFKDKQRRPMRPMFLYSKMPMEFAVELYNQAKTNPTIVKKFMEQGVGGLFESRDADGRQFKPEYGERLVLVDRNQLIPPDMRKRDGGKKLVQYFEEPKVIIDKIVSDPGVPW